MLISTHMNKAVIDSLLLRRFVFRMAEASAKRVTGDEPQGTMGRVFCTSIGGNLQGQQIRI